MFIRNIEIPVEKCKIFCKINETLLEDAFNKIHFQIKSFPKGSIINTRNSTCNNMMIVLKGIVKTELSDLKGTTVHVYKNFFIKPRDKYQALRRSVSSSGLNMSFNFSSS